jgi:hypothetical protein
LGYEVVRDKRDSHDDIRYVHAKEGLVVREFHLRVEHEGEIVASGYI